MVDSKPTKGNEAISFNYGKTGSNSAEISLELLRVSKDLEKIADLSTNIAEDVIFHLKALDVKHHT